MRKSRIGINIASSLIQQAVSVVCGFILPRLILNSYGSAYNGIVTSVSQFLSCVTLLRSGIGGVTRAALYQSLADHETDKTAAIVKATEHFMRKVAWIFGGALLVFAAIYPLLVKEEFDWLFSFSLVLILGISTIVQYYFGIANQFLLHADQRLYVHNIWYTVSVILNTLFSVLLIRAGVEIRLVKLCSAAAFSLPPVMLHLYVRRRYAFKKNIVPDFGAIRQRWDAFAHQLASFVHTNTDIMVLTVFTDLRQVSVYSVYHVITNSLNMLILSATNAVEASLGKLLARKDQTQLRKQVDSYELIMHVVSTIVFGCAAILIVPFVRVYTMGVHDADYNQPVMGLMMCLAYWIAAIRLPYQNVIEAAGHFKQTKKMAIVEAVLNVALSCVLVNFFGAVGVVFGTVIAMSYRTVCYVCYALKKILQQPMKTFVKRFAVSVATWSAIAAVYCWLPVQSCLETDVFNYWDWFIAAILVFVFVTGITLVVNFLFYKRRLMELIRLVRHK